MIVKKEQKVNNQIQTIQTTNANLTDRAGLNLFTTYLHKTETLDYLAETFPDLKKSNKGLSVKNFFLQMFSFLTDGTSRYISYFDELMKDKSYSTILGVNQDELASSHAINRMIAKFSLGHSKRFNAIFSSLFLNRLKQENPEIIVLDIDTVVFDNSNSKKKQGNKWTYKKVNGFHPTFVKWNGDIIFSDFQAGSTSNNRKGFVAKTLKRIVKNIRDNYNADVPIILTMDSGYFDQKIYKLCEDELKIGFVSAGKFSEKTRQLVAELDLESCEVYKKTVSNKEVYEYRFAEFSEERASWDRSRRLLYTVINKENGQLKLALEDRIYYTNIGITEEFTEQLKAAGQEEYLSLDKVFELARSRGNSELTHRYLKDFGFEELPFESFASNRAFFQIMILAFNLFNSFKSNCIPEAKNIYARTFRRKYIDIAGKIVHHSNQVILKITKFKMEQLDFFNIWQRCNSSCRLL